MSNTTHITKEQADDRFQTKDKAEQDRHFLKESIQSAMQRVEKQISDLATVAGKSADVSAENSKNIVIATQKIVNMEEIFAKHMEREDKDREQLIATLKDMNEESKKKVDRWLFLWIIGGICTIIAFMFVSESSTQKSIASIETILDSINFEVVTP